MKLFLVLLIVCHISAPEAHGIHNIQTEDDCNIPYKVFKDWAESPCATGNVTQFVTQYGAGDVKESAKQYCSVVRGQVRACFKDIIKTHCPTKENELMEIADHTSVICDGTSVLPGVDAFLKGETFASKTDSTSCKTTLDAVDKVTLDETETDFTTFLTNAKSEFQSEITNIVNAAKNCPDNKAWQAMIRMIQDSDINRPEPFGVDLSAELTNAFLENLFSPLK